MTWDAITNYFSEVWANSLGLFLNPGHFLSVFPLLVAFVIGLTVVATRLARKSGGRIPSARRIVAVMFPKRVFLHKSARLDYWVFFINQGVLFFLTISAFLSPAIVSEIALTVARQFGYTLPNPDTGLTERIVYSAMLVLLWDFGATYAHYLKHRVPILWELHKVHHSAEVMTPVTALRRHPLEAVFGSIVSAVVVGLGVAVWSIVFGRDVMPVSVFGTLAGIWLWRVAGYNLRHTHIWISYGDFWNRIFISPAQHQVHHSNAPEHYDTNFGHIFAFWDKLFGTLYLPSREERVEFGIDKEEMPEYTSLFGLYVLPLIKIWRHMRPKSRAKSFEHPAE